MRSCKYLALATALALSAPHAVADKIVAARFTKPVDRYGHFALGQPHEYARVSATTESGKDVSFELPSDEVFEDITPRIVSLATGEPQEILAIVSSRNGGSRLMLLRLAGERLEISAQSPAIGTPMRWLNLVGVADLDGDGQAEISAVLTPHIGGTLKVYRKKGQALVEIAALSGFSNHINGTVELALSMPVAFQGQLRLVVPDKTRLQLRIIALQSGHLVEAGRCVLPSPIVGPMKLVKPSVRELLLLTGTKRISLANCGKN